MNKKKLMFRLAAQVAVAKKDRRIFLLGAVGIRSDGTIVCTSNGSSNSVNERTKAYPPAHAESKLCKKLDNGATVYVVRVARDGSWVSSKPCPDCMRILKSSKVKVVHYTISNNEFGTIYL